jgi:deoxycytidylate deaminase
LALTAFAACLLPEAQSAGPPARVVYGEAAFRIRKRRAPCQLRGGKKIFLITFNLDSMADFLERNSAEERWMEAAAEQARLARCHKRRCGAVVVSGGEIIGAGYNAPPQDDEGQRRCGRPKTGGRPGYDQTCCVHAEWRAITDALRRHGGLVPGAALYFVRVDADGKMTSSGAPFCTVCSRLALDAGLAWFALRHADGIRLYATDEYNRLSYAYEPAD